MWPGHGMIHGFDPKHVNDRVMMMSSICSCRNKKWFDDLRGQKSRNFPKLTAVVGSRAGAFPPEGGRGSRPARARCRLAWQPSSASSRMHCGAAHTRRSSAENSDHSGRVGPRSLTETAAHSSKRAPHRIQRDFSCLTSGHAVNL